MREAGRPVAVIERACLAVLLIWIAALPLPFGSVIERARVPLVAVPLALGIVALVVRIYSTRDRTTKVPPTPGFLILSSGAALFIGVVALQLVPLSPPLLRAISPASEAIWRAAAHLASLGGAAVPAEYPITIDPQSTAFELLRLISILAAFSTSAVLIRNHARRQALAFVLCFAGIFETMYGVHEAALQRYAIWGWVNRLIFQRVTGTFVNPNHFAHYLAIVLPMALFLVAVTWHYAGAEHMPPRRRLAVLLEQHPFLAGFAVLAALICVGGMLLAQSRGALLALTVAALAMAAMLPGRRTARLLLAAASGLVLLITLVLFLGPQRTVARFLPSKAERETFVGRRIGLSAAIRLWKRFPVAGSGFGTFDRAIFLEQREDLEKTYHHAHDDYAEFAATTGTVGFAIALTALIGGYTALVRMTFDAASRELRWKRRAFQAAALMSLTVAMVHAFFDFNFFIPANPSTLACILGAAVASVDRDKRTRR